MTLRNRLVMSPMETCYATKQGLPSDRMIAYFVERAKGKVGLITLGACTVDDRHREVLNTIHFSDDTVIDEHRRLTDLVHAEGAKIQPQLMHPGPDGLAPFLSGIPSVGPSVIPSYITGTPCVELDANGIQKITQLYGEAARRIRACGYDGIELHAAHGYMLLGSFLTPWRNRRADAYSGTTIEGRTRLLLEVLAEIHNAAGADFPVTVRMSGDERVAGGRDVTDSVGVAQMLEDAGASALHISGGVIDRFTTQMVAGAGFPAGLNVSAAAAVRRAVSIPVIAVGRIHDVEFAERILSDGSADFVAMGRPLIADPNLAKKSRVGDVESIRRCISCQNCIDSMEEVRMGCAINPRAGHEALWPIGEAVPSKRVAVIGGGPAGMEAARIAAERGHEVHLFERNSRLGGAMTAAAVVHEENLHFHNYLIREVTNASLRLELNCAVSADDIVGLAPDVAIVATGGMLTNASVEGGDLAHVTRGSDLRRMLSGQSGDASGSGERPEKTNLVSSLVSRAASNLRPEWLRRFSTIWLPFGRRVVVVGTDLAAVELAEFLAEFDRVVSLIGSGGHDSKFIPEAGPKRRAEHVARLDELGVIVNVEANVTRIFSDTVELRCGETLSVIDADSVILAGELQPDTSLADALVDRVPQVEAIGDCTGLGLIRKATADAARVAYTI